MILRHHPDQKEENHPSSIATIAITNASSPATSTTSGNKMSTFDFSR